MSALDPFAKPHPSDSSESFHPTQGDMAQIPHEEDGQDWTRAIIALLCVGSFFIGLVIGGVAGAAIVLGAL